VNVGNFTAEIISKAGALHDALDRIGKQPSDVTEPLVKEILRGGFNVNVPVVGRMYTFTYEAKYKNTLPFWDAQPVVLVIQLHDNGDFTGLNFHYLPLDLRVKCFYLLDHQTRPNDTKTLSVTWEKLVASAAKKMAEVTVKRYIKKNLKSRLTQIPAKNWFLALALPLADFRKATELQVNAISKKHVGAG
jgi:hypothetical protein